MQKRIPFVGKRVQIAGKRIITGGAVWARMPGSNFATKRGNDIQHGYLGAVRNADSFKADQFARAQAAVASVNGTGFLLLDKVKEPRFVSRGKVQSRNNIKLML